MIILTDIGTFATVFVGVLIILGIIGIAMLILSIQYDRTNRKLEATRTRMKQVLDEGRGSIAESIREECKGFRAMSVADFAEMNLDLAHHCINYGEQRGLDHYVAIEDTLIYLESIFRAYAECVDPSDPERCITIVSDTLRSILLAEAAEAERRKLLRGGLSEGA